MPGEALLGGEEERASLVGGEEDPDDGCVVAIDAMIS
jgi:hypothetical protein